MSTITVLHCDRCNTEIRCEAMNPWHGWKRDAKVEASGFNGAPDWISPFVWTGTLCTACASHVDNALHNLFAAPVDGEPE